MCCYDDGSKSTTKLGITIMIFIIIIIIRIMLI